MLYIPVVKGFCLLGILALRFSPTQQKYVFTMLGVSFLSVITLLLTFIESIFLVLGVLFTIDLIAEEPSSSFPLAS